MDFAMTISGVFFVQSLRPGDTPTGREVHGHVRPLLLHKGMHSEPSVRNVVSADDLMAALRDIRQVVSAQRLHPAIQIDAHGDVDGLQLTDGTIVPWIDLAGPLREINAAAENNLLLCSAMCHGGHLCRIAMSPGAFLASPYWAILGPMKSLSAGDLQAACQGFWSMLLANEDAPAAISAFNAAAGTASFVQCEMLFGRIWMRYVMEMMDDPDGLDARVERIHRASRGRATHDWIRARLCDMAALESGYREMHEQFLWLDKFPRHRHRYNMTFADACRMFPFG